VSPRAVVYVLCCRLQKAHGDDSDLHIIIFDEIDAICKQRGSNRDGTGVHDSIVNQLLSKIDGVDSLNNILLIGMTNRKDMIDEALLRPGRLEIHLEIGLPDETGRISILNIHTSKIRASGRLADVRRRRVWRWLRVLWCHVYVSGNMAGSLCLRYSSPSLLPSSCLVSLPSSRSHSVAALAPHPTLRLTLSVMCPLCVTVADTVAVCVCVCVRTWTSSSSQQRRRTTRALSWRVLFATPRRLRWRRRRTRRTPQGPRTPTPSASPCPTSCMHSLR
jgi:hypothetical protein